MAFPPKKKAPAEGMRGMPLVPPKKYRVPMKKGKMPC